MVKGLWQSQRIVQPAIGDGALLVHKETTLGSSLQNKPRGNSWTDLNHRLRVQQ